MESVRGPGPDKEMVDRHDADYHGSGLRPAGSDLASSFG